MNNVTDTWLSDWLLVTAVTSCLQVFIINLLRDSKYFHFRPVMDTYIQKHFAGALAYK